MHIPGDTPMATVLSRWPPEALLPGGSRLRKLVYRRHLFLPNSGALVDVCPPCMHVGAVDVFVPPRCLFLTLPLPLLVYGAPPLFCLPSPHTPHVLDFRVSFFAFEQPQLFVSGPWGPAVRLLLHTSGTP